MAKVNFLAGVAFLVGLPTPPEATLPCLAGLPPGMARGPRQGVTTGAAARQHVLCPARAWRGAR